MASYVTPALKKRGLAESKLLTQWPSIVGPVFCEISQPDQLRFPRDSRTGGTLRVRVANGWAMEFQHQSAVILEKIATYFGYRAVDRLTIVQDARLIAERTAVPPPPPAPLNAEHKQELADALSQVDDTALQDQLARLGEAIFRKQETLEHKRKAP